MAWLPGLICSLMGCQNRSNITVASVKSDAAVQYAQGVKLMQSGNVTAAQTAFETALRTDTTYVPAYFALAEIKTKTGDTPRSIELLETLHRISPQTPHVECHLAELHVASGHFIEGLTAAKKARQSEPACPLANTEYALALAAAGNTREVVAALQMAHRLTPQSERIALLLAQMLARAGKPEEAWKVIDNLPSKEVSKEASKEASKETSSAPSMTVSGWLLAEYGRAGKHNQNKSDQKAATELLDLALKVTPDDGPANLEKGRILLRLGKPREALACLQKAARAMEPDTELLLTTAEAQTKVKNPAALHMTQSAHAFEKMVNALQTARQRYLAAPNDRNNLVRLARLEAESGNAQDAQTLLTEILKQNPNDTEALGLMTNQEGDSPSAEKTGK